MTPCEGTLFNIQRASLDDGPGVRTVLFFKGCPLHCFWCHNPESQSMRPEMLVHAARCKKCGQCAPLCPESAIREARIDRARCTACGRCARACTHGALTQAGKRYTVSEAVEEALLDRAFFAATGGGVTLSGGEPLAQLEFALNLLRALKEQDIHTCIETCGVCADGPIESLAPFVDHWLYDVKLTDEALHQSLLGVPLSDVTRGLYTLRQAGAAITLRCVILPGINDNDAHFSAVRALARQVGAEAVDILPYHRLGGDKYAQLGRESPRELATPDEESIRAWESAVKLSSYR